MVFNSLTFIVFFIVLMLIYHALSDWNLKKIFLLFMSYIFYGAWNPPFVLLLIISTAIDWYAAKGIEASTTKFRKKFFLIISLTSNLGLLGFFKYGNFLIANGRWTAGLFGYEQDWQSLDIILPVGISFYTFQTLSYTIDVYRGDMRPARSLVDFGLYVTFFPQLVAGPIVRAIDFIPQCVEPKKPTPILIGWGLYFMTLGLFQKVVLADVFLSGAADQVFNWDKGAILTLDAWVGVLAFSGQIFFDFAGYSTCAIGASMCLGFFLPDNFHFPYSSLGFSDFWKRWHISLSSWLKDYLYISLGGNRYGASKRTINLLFTMLAGGLWHGAAWTFVIWGGLHGLFLVIEHWLKSQFHTIDITKGLFGRSLLRIFTFILICFTWVFFRASDFNRAKVIILSMLGMIPDGTPLLTSIEIFKVLFVMTGLIATHWYMSETHLERIIEKLPSLVITIFWSLMLFTLIISQGGANAFIYFQF